MSVTADWVLIIWAATLGGDPLFGNDHLIISLTPMSNQKVCEHYRAAMVPKDGHYPLHVECRNLVANPLQSATEGNL